MKGTSMTEDSWTKVRHGDIQLGDTVRVTRKDGCQTTITEGKVTQYEVYPDGHVWSVEDFENFYLSEFVADEDGAFSIVERLTPPFEWPTKLGAVITGTTEGETVYAVLVEEAADEHDVPLWWTRDWGSVNMYDIEGLDDLTVVAEGVTLGD